MVVAMIAVGMMQVGFDEIIDMVAVRHRLVPAIRAVFVPELVTAAIVIGRAALRVLCTNFQNMVLDQRGASGANRVMQVAVVKVIDVTAVFDTGMVAVWAVPVTIVGMGVGIAHKIGR